MPDEKYFREKRRGLTRTWSKVLDVGVAVAVLLWCINVYLQRAECVVFACRNLAAVRDMTLPVYFFMSIAS